MYLFTNTRESSVKPQTLTRRNGTRVRSPDPNRELGLVLGHNLFSDMRVTVAIAILLRALMVVRMSANEGEIGRREGPVGMLKMTS